MPEVIGNLDDVLATVRARVEAQAKAREEEARRRAEHILADARAQAEQMRATILRRAQMDADKERRRILAQAELALQQERLRARERLLRRVWEEAEAQLRALPDDPHAYAPALQRLTWLALKTLGPTHLLLAADPKGHELLTRHRLAAWQRSARGAFGSDVILERAQAPADTWGGLVAREAEGRRQVDATFPTRLALAWEVLREKIFAILEGDHE